MAAQQMTDLQYHEWCQQQFPLGARLYVKITDPMGPDLELVGEVTGHPYEWQEGGDAESGPCAYIERIGVEVTADGESVTPTPAPPDQPDSDNYGYDEVVRVTDEPLGWRSGLDELRAEREHYAKREREDELERQHGGRTRCPKCDQFTVEHGEVCTLGYPGHPGAEFSGLASCQNPDCDYNDLAG